MSQATFDARLRVFIKSHSFDRKPKTQRFYRFVSKIVLENWHDAKQPVSEISEENIFDFAAKVSHYSASYWNSCVAALRFITPHGKLLKRRKMKLNAFVPPEQNQFNKFLSECDTQAERSKANLVVRFLMLCGTRIEEGRGILKTDIFHAKELIHIRAEVSKNGQERWIPFLPGMKEAIDRLLRLDGTGDFLLPRENNRKAIANASKRAGIGRLTHHKIRHFFTTRCIECGVDTQTVAIWLGHLDKGALLSTVYFHLRDSHSRRMAQMVTIAA